MNARQLQGRKDQIVWQASRLAKRKGHKKKEGKKRHQAKRPAKRKRRRTGGAGSDQFNGFGPAKEAVVTRASLSPPPRIGAAAPC